MKIQWLIRQATFGVGYAILVCGLLFGEDTLPGDPTPPPAPAPQKLLSAEELNTLVAPIALYPDALLSQVLVASTYPLELVELGQWLNRNSELKGSALVDAARQQNWDASIQALVVFPDVVKRLNADVRWTTDLGNAFLAQQADVMNAVQRMRAQAMESGKLKSNSQQTVNTEKQGDRSVIEIQPANPEVVYVPYYDPAYVWGPPLYGYYPYWGYPYYGFGFGWGAGIYIGGFFGGLYWGGWGWGANWYHCSVYQNHYFFNHYGYGGHGYGGAWAHNPYHRQGVGYTNSAVSQRYAGATPTRGAPTASRFSGQANASGQYNAASRASVADAGSWRRFNQSGQTSQSYQRGFNSNTTSTANNGYRANPSSSGNRSYVSRFQSSPSSVNSNGYNRNPSYSRSYSGTSSTPSYRSSPSYGNSNGYNMSRSFNGGSGITRSAPRIAPASSR
ncbi:MAG: DUF3300 domain-containing protein [Terriglobia bacterium]